MRPCWPPNQQVPGQLPEEGGPLSFLDLPPTPVATEAWHCGGGAGSVLWGAVGGEEVMADEFRNGGEGHPCLPGAQLPTSPQLPEFQLFPRLLSGLT